PLYFVVFVLGRSCPPLLTGLSFLLCFPVPRLTVKNIENLQYKRRPVIHKCTRCGKGYQLETSLRRHQRLECGVEPRQSCPICGKKFMHRFKMTHHLASASGDDAAESRVATTAREQRPGLGSRGYARYAVQTDQKLEELEGRRSKIHLQQMRENVQGYHVAQSSQEARMRRGALKLQNVSQKSTDPLALPEERE
uniref:transcription factor Ovo-like 2 n=1 Tax=Osmia lignaria TaxID=473952 RepID=UPI001478534D